MDHSLTALPPLETLRAFEAAACAGSFSGAAEVLHLTHGAVSRQVMKLEHWLGQRLFERQARGVTLTPEGQRLLLRTREAFAMIADTSDRWQDPRGAAVVRISSPPSICGLWLLPRLTQLEDGAPKLRVLLMVDHRQLDLGNEGIDLAIRCGRGTVPDRQSVRLFEEHCFPIAAPHLAAAIGTGDPARLLNWPLIHDSDASGWRSWFAAQGLDYKPRPQDRRFEDYNLVLDAAACGLGLALARPPLAAAQVAAGRVVQVDPRTALNPVSYWLDRPVGAMRDAAVQLARRIGSEAGLAPESLSTFMA
ncbi:LysR substrate-binding domain-containing protein [Methylovirgula sp. 4M-Z18]|uniref:LysR substrate-binding domain-containing protein n=1 Tax=Methylovirgula sp. 4M-Z18 TaxID=2293567 RepID=UPI000E2EFBA4|nr:LysR substrate-binding domain-containing protein [Methylovirgula sp. 4M-Z18]RFB78570.1 LysR family transcriptional regulator [Methylovirgula sp. 4M-Z18]